jgi:hypothetical protein
VSTRSKVPFRVGSFDVVMMAFMLLTYRPDAGLRGTFFKDMVDMRAARRVWEAYHLTNPKAGMTWHVHGSNC